MLPCAYCSKLFPVTRYNRIYCSTRCNAKASAHRVRAREKAQFDAEAAELMKKAEIATPQLAADELTSQALAKGSSEQRRADTADAMDWFKKTYGNKE